MIILTLLVEEQHYQEDDLNERKESLVSEQEL